MAGELGLGGRDVVKLGGPVGADLLHQDGNVGLLELAHHPKVLEDLSPPVVSFLGL